MFSRNGGHKKKNENILFVECRKMFRRTTALFKDYIQTVRVAVGISLYRGYK